MSRNTYTIEQIIGMRRDAEVLLSQGQKTSEVIHRPGITEQDSWPPLLGDPFLNLDFANSGALNQRAKAWHKITYGTLSGLWHS